MFTSDDDDDDVIWMNGENQPKDWEFVRFKSILK